MGIALPSVLIVMACVVIWRACDGFEVASKYLGRNLSDGVRGGTINAISSSIPELMTTLIALLVLADEEGFAVGLGTTAGSALFNGMIIPAACILTVVGSVVAGSRVTSIRVSSKVILRDGLMLLACEVVLIGLVSGSRLDWWQGLGLLAMYVVYFGWMLLSMGPSGETAGDQPRGDMGHPEIGGRADGGIIGGSVYWASGGPLLDLERWLVGSRHREQMRDETWNPWPLLVASTSMIGAACWVLVHACQWLGTGPGNGRHAGYDLFGLEFQGIGMPSMFVAVIFASMATSVPDTVISVRDARGGDYDDAVANALGSNIFDICFALGLPILVYTFFWGAIEIPVETATQTGEILVLLFVITLCGFVTYYVGPRVPRGDGKTLIEMRRGTALTLILLYLAFVAFIVARAHGADWAEFVASRFGEVLDRFPRVAGY